MAYKVVRGFAPADETKGSTVVIYTLGGERISVEKSDIKQAFANEPAAQGAAPLTTFFIKPTATIQVEVNLADQHQEAGTRTGPWDTTFKYYDDGGTIPKSYDDFMIPTGGPGTSTITKYIDDGGTISKSRDDL